MGGREQGRVWEEGREHKEGCREGGREQGDGGEVGRQGTRGGREGEGI